MSNSVHKANPAIWCDFCKEPCRPHFVLEREGKIICQECLMKETGEKPAELDAQCLSKL